MNTPTHLLIGLAAFGRKDKPTLNTSAILGAIAPDLSLFLMAGWALFAQGIGPDIVFGQYYFSDQWQMVFRIDNSFILWGAAFGFAVWRDSKVLASFAGAGFLHLCFDFPFHHDDARSQFWPLTDWVYESPISYWDVAHYGGMIAPAEVIGVCLLLGLLFRRHQHIVSRIILTGLAMLVVLPMIIFGLMGTA